MEQRSETDEQLAMQAAREGSDGPAFVELVRRYQQPVWRICYRLMGNEHDAQDAAQEVFVRLFTARARFEGRSRYGTWAHSVAVRTCLTLRRARGRRQRRVQLGGDTLERASEPRQPAEGLHMDLALMLDTLDDEDRAMLILKYAEEYTYERLAEIFDLSVSACKMRVSRSRDRLKKQYPEEVESGGRQQS